MAVKIRLNRVGTTKKPYYRIVAIDSRIKRNGRYLEILGTYDPCNRAVPKDSEQRQKKGIVHVKTDRVQYWLGVGAEASPTVRSILKRLKMHEKTAA